MYKETKKNAVVAAIINIVLSAILVKPFGVTGVLIATCIGYLYMHPLNVKVIYQNVDMNYANEVYKNLLKNYVTLNDNEIEFRISKNEVNNGGTDYVSLISKYINGDSTQNFWFDDFCWGHKDGAMNADLLPAYYCQPFRITINIMCSSDILKENEHRLIFPQSDIITSEVQIANAVSSDFFKGIAIGTQQEYAGNINLSDYLKKFRDDYFRRLNVAVYEINKILQEFAPDLTVFDILTEKPFEINQEGIIPMEEIKKINFQ